VSVWSIKRNTYRYFLLILSHTQYALSNNLYARMCNHIDYLFYLISCKIIKYPGSFACVCGFLFRNQSLCISAAPYQRFVMILFIHLFLRTVTPLIINICYHVHYKQSFVRHLTSFRFKLSCLTCLMRIFCTCS
jgi:hypothetical protein